MNSENPRVVDLMRRAVEEQLSEETHDLKMLSLQLIQLKTQAKDLSEQQELLKNIRQRNEAVEEDTRRLKEFCTSYELFKQCEETDRLVEEVEAEATEEAEIEAKIQRLKEENQQMKQRKEECLRQMEKRKVNKKFMEKVVQQTQFKDVDALASHLGNLLHIRDQLSEKNSDKLAQVDQLKKQQQAAEVQHHLKMVHSSSQTSLLWTQLENACSQAVIWEEKWKYIQETAEQKTLLLGQIKMASTNLFELAGGSVGGEGGVDLNNTETQLETVKTFIQDNDDLVRQYHTFKNQKTGDNGNKDKKPEQKALHNPRKEKDISIKKIK